MYTTVDNKQLSLPNLNGRKQHVFHNMHTYREPVLKLNQPSTIFIPLRSTGVSKSLRNGICTEPITEFSPTNEPQFQTDTSSARFIKFISDSSW